MKLKFTLRDFFWLTLVAAVAMGWYVRESGWTSRFKTESQQLDLEVEKVNAFWRRAFADDRDDQRKQIRDHLVAVNAFRRGIEQEGYDWELQNRQGTVLLCTTLGDISTIQVTSGEAGLHVELTKRAEP